MKLANCKIKIRRALDFLLTLSFFGNINFLFSLLRINGLTSYIENEFLFKCASDGYGRGLIVEVGCYHGRSTIVLGLGSKSKGREKVYAIDPLQDSQARNSFLKNIKRVKLQGYIIPDFRKSEEANAEFNSDIRLIFIDGSHNYEDVKKDILLWKRFLVDGGIIALHDYLPKNNPCYVDGVHKAVEECIINSDDFIVEGCIDTILFASKNKSENKLIFRPFNKFHKTRQYLKSLIDRSCLSL